MFCHRSEKRKQFGCRDEGETEKQSENSSDSSDEGHLGDLFLSQISRDVRILDVHLKLDQIGSAVNEGFLDQHIAEV
jgi:hypothetical protein